VTTATQQQNYGDLFAGTCGATMSFAKKQPPVDQISQTGFHLREHVQIMHGTPTLHHTRNTLKTKVCVVSLKSSDP
jgi:hypothetical protein